MSIKGPGGHRSHPSREQGYYKNLIKIMKGEPVAVKKKRKFRPGHTGPREQPERELVNKIVDWLRLAGCKAGVIKTKGSYLDGRHLKDKRLFKSVPDILCYQPKNKTWWWIETKSGYNKLTKRLPEHGSHEYSQEEFQNWCLEAKANHIVAKKLEDVFVITGSHIEGAIG